MVVLEGFVIRLLTRLVPTSYVRSLKGLRTVPDVDGVGIFMPTIGETILDALQYVRSAGVSDIIDILLIAFLIYKITDAVRAAGLSNVMRGILVLAAFYVLSGLFGLNVVSFLLRWVFQLGLVALVIIFQPELRRFLSRVGTSRIRSIFAGSIQSGGMEAVITQTVTACTDMAKNKVGALIVFERSDSLESYVNTGTILNAEATSELIMSVFFPNSPLHDGAMLITGDARAAAAGCVLPLSTSTTLSGELGMRHRAGIGLSEQTDALVVILSEESGAISVALGGKLKRRLSADVFEDLLRAELTYEDENHGGGVFNFLLNLFKVRNEEKN